MIESYRFGQIVIDGHAFSDDVIVFPHRVQPDWWRKEGHLLHVEDIQKAVDETKPRVLVVGTGKFGVMKIAQEVSEYLVSEDIVLHAEKTDKATKIYNRLILTDPKILGAFHLTC